MPTTITKNCQTLRMKIKAFGKFHDGKLLDRTSKVKVSRAEAWSLARMI